MVFYGAMGAVNASIGVACFSGLISIGGGIVKYSDDLDFPLESAFRAMNAALVVVNRRACVCYCNDGFAQLHGFPGVAEFPPDVAGLAEIIEVFGADGCGVPVEGWAVMRAIRGEDVRNLVVRLQRKDTDDAWFVSYSFAPVRSELGEIVGATGVVTDMTEAMKIKNHLEVANMRLGLAKNLSGLGVWDWQVRSDQMFWDERMLELYGIPQDGFSGNVQAWVAALHPDDKERASAQVEAALRGEHDFDTEFRIIRPDQTEVFLKAAGTVIRGKDGQAVRMIGVNSDITPQKRAEEETRQAGAEVERRVEERTRELESERAKLAQSEARLRQAQKMARMGDFEWDLDSGVMNWSDELFRVWRIDPADGAPTVEALASRVLPSHRQEFMQVIDVAAKQGVPWDLTYPWQGPDGELHFNHTVGMAVSGESGSVRLVGVVQDVTEAEQLKRLASEARETAEAANRAKDLFLATLSHELRSPLTAILLWTQLLQRGGLSAEKSDIAIRTIRANALSQNQLIDDLLDVSRIISGKIPLRKTVFRLAESIILAVESVMPSAELKGIAVELECDQCDGLVFGDPVRIRQIMWNLLQNAIKFTPAGGRVDVTVHCDDSEAIVEVRDTGQGISAEDFPRLFTPFWQADSTPQRQQGGLGLGLSIVDRLVKLHEGSVSATSRGPGKGATFSVRLPLSSSAEQNGAIRETKTPVRAGVDERLLDGLRILLVEDDTHSRDAIETALQVKGAQVNAVGSGMKALESLQEYQPDIIVSDIAMPGMDGCEFLRRARELPRHNGVSCPAPPPALALSAYSDETSVRAALDAGFVRHLQKPIEVEDLCDAILAATSHGDDHAQGPVDQS